MPKNLKDKPLTAIYTGDEKRMSVYEEEKFKEDMMRQAEEKIKKGEVEQAAEDGQWIDNADVMKKLNEQKDENSLVEDMTDKNKDVEIRKGIDPKSFQYELLGRCS